MPSVQSITKASDSITTDQHTWIFFMFTLLVIGLLISTYTTYTQRNVENEEQGKSYIQASAAGYIIAATANCYIKSP